MAEHMGPRRGARTPPVEPTFAERARTLIHAGRMGMLSTLSRRHAGHPFGSVMPYAPDGAGRPLVLISRMAVHTQNLESDARASLLVAQESPPGAAPEEPLGLGRVTLLGRARAVPAGEAPAARARYLARHESAAHWVDFGDFAFWRLDVAAVYFVGGFGAMGWLEEKEYAAARPDPLADAAAGIMEHMNRDHADALLGLARAFAGADAEQATMVAVDRLGFKLRLWTGGRRHSARVAFPREIATADETRAVLVEMVAQARRPAEGS